MPSRSNTDEKLLRESTAGDQGAIDELLDRHLGGLRAFVRLRAGKMIRAKESVSDLVQSVCREVIEHADRYEHGGELGFKHWLYKTALRKIASRQRYYEAEKRDVGREKRPQSATTDAALLDCYATLCTPSQVAMGHEQRDLIEAAFDRLPEAHRDVIVFAKIVGLSHAETAREMGRSETAVRSLLYRALIDLMENLDRLRGD